jgi:hypothetical protein
MTVITPTAWQRMPWHPKARLIAALEARAQHLRDEVTALEAKRDELADLLNDNVQLSTNAHAAYARGVRDPWAIAGEREYQRNRKRRERAERRAS